MAQESALTSSSISLPSQNTLINSQNQAMETLDTIHKPPVISPPPEPPSLNSSPSHEFSFTISLSSASTTSLKLSKPSHNFPEFDLSPADELFFHGHLLPLHFLSHRPSNASIETEHKLCKSMASKTSPKTPVQTAHISSDENELTKRIKPTPFSSFFNLRKWRRGGEDRDEEKQSMKKKNTVFGRLWRKYASFIEPILFFKVVKEKREFRRSSYSFSGNPPEGGWRRRWRGDFSAPASMRTSPANSGLLVAPTSAFCSSDESSMEELQNAIQAAIAHCKNSGGVKEEKCGS